MRVGWAPSIVSTIVEHRHRHSTFSATVTTAVTITITSFRHLSGHRFACTDHWAQETKRNLRVAHTVHIYISRYHALHEGAVARRRALHLRTVRRRPESSNEVLFNDRRETSRRRPLTAPRVITPVVPCNFYETTTRSRCSSKNIHRSGIKWITTLTIVKSSAPWKGKCA